MQLTAQNIDKVLENAGLLIVARQGADGNTHLGHIRRGEIVDYGTTVTYNDPESLVTDLDLMLDTDAAVIHKFPNRQSAQYVVKYGEVL